MPILLAELPLTSSVTQHMRRQLTSEGAALLCCSVADRIITIIIINPCKPYLTASAPRLTHWGGGK
jgi:hypothetical protein